MMKTCFSLAMLLMVLPGMLGGQQQKKYVPPDYERKMQAIKDFEAGVEPLFVLGDLNEDGVVDEKDLQLARAYVETHRPAGISCLAAADVNSDGRVDAKDIASLEQALKKGPVEAPPLVFHSSIPCDYRNFFIAARSGARPGGTVPVHFLEQRFNTENSSVTVQSGEATASKTKSAYLVQVAKSARPESLIKLAISVADGKKYSYTFSVVPPR
jgi:hypothetical protein